MTDSNNNNTTTNNNIDNNDKYLFTRILTIFVCIHSKQTEWYIHTPYVHTFNNNIKKLINDGINGYFYATSIKFKLILHDYVGNATEFRPSHQL